MNYRSKSDGLSEAIDKLRAELGVIKEELRVIDLRRPALESRATRIQEALTTLMGDGSTGDPRWMSLPRITQGGLEQNGEAYDAGPRPVIHRGPKQKAGPLHKPEISEDAVIAMALYLQSNDRSVKSSELYEHLIKEGQMEPIETEMPYKSFAITLRNIHQDLIEYSRATKTWTLKDRSPKEKLREALEKGGGTRVVSSHSLPVNREDHLFVKTVSNIFKENHWESLKANRIYDELSEKRDFGLIPGVGNLADFKATLAAYQDFFSVDETTGLYRATRPENSSSKYEVANGAPGLYTVKQNGGVAA
jgi:hypothetical protein